MANFSGDWLEPLTELTHFYGAHVRLPPLCSPNQLRNVTVWGSTISGGYCGRLQNLSLSDVTWEGAASTWSWLASCTHLRYLKLDNIFKKRTASSGADTLEYSDLKWMGERRLQLTLSKVQSISYNMSHYWEVVRGNCTELAVNISVRGSVRCDWRTYWFARTLQACPRHVVWGAVPSCTQLYARVPLPANLTSVRPEHMLRPLKEEHMCADGCNCYWSEEEGSGVVADCSRRALTRPPAIPRLVLLHAGGNYIHTVHRDYLNDTLLELDLRNNNISAIPAEVCARLFSVPERLVMLAGNPLQCNCDNQPLLRELLHHRDQVDYQHLKCGDGKLLSTIDVQMLCLIGKEIHNTKETQLLNMIRKEIYIVLSVLLLAAGYVYSDKLKELIRLCRRKLCQCCMRE
ncbi:uncharacterized protein LOC131855329 [Achroia grisella]|uniref:uncharacterized protein LOC131855329 n=1 Tax=Achroia grisella TaxID=688607 RepID=UPI0027D29A95|nr:uncharacterized protein LOC131855329 [Achroia grisella]